MKTHSASEAKFPRSSKRKEILLVTVAAVITLIVSAIVSFWLSNTTNLTFPTIGTIRMKGVEGYWDLNLTNKTEEYDWGMISPGASRNVTLYLRSISNIETTLYQATGNWTFWNSGNEIAAGPSNSTPYLYLTWDYDNSTLQPGEIIQITLTLHARSSSEFIEFLVAKDVKAFSFDIQISTSQRS